MLYRLYQPGDFAALYAVEELCFQPPARFPRATMRSLVNSPNAATWIAEENAELAGFAIVVWEKAPAKEPRAAYIETVEVAPGHRERGVAGELLHRVEDSARAAGAEAIWLHVDAENTAAVRLYERRGYAKQGREEHYYARNRAALIYTKPLAIASGSRSAP
ncbi:MAG: N-acetyltransferase [Terracidiphilus sp.]